MKKNILLATLIMIGSINNIQCTDKPFYSSIHKKLPGTEESFNTFFHNELTEDLNVTFDSNHVVEPGSEIKHRGTKKRCTLTAKGYKPRGLNVESDFKYTITGSIGESGELGTLIVTSALI